MIYSHLPAVFSYTSTRMVLAAMTSLLISIFLGPFFIRRLYAMKIGQPIRKEECPLLGELHQKKEDTPTMGGILILASMMISMFFWMDWASHFTLLLLLTTVVLGLLGGYDDYLKLKARSSRGLRGKKKLAIQCVFSGAIGIYLLASVPTDLYIPFFKNPVISLGSIGFVFWTMFVITGTSNAVNLSDGLDGLATGLIIMVAAVLGTVAFLSSNADLSDYLNILHVDGAAEIAIYLSAMVGACVGFLWYNGHPAQVFMGDIGSIALGGILGLVAVLLRREVLLALVGGVFVVETLSVILQVGSYKLRNKKRVFLCAPLHHHFEYKGWPETKVVLRFWIIGLLLAIIGLASLKFQ